MAETTYVHGACPLDCPDGCSWTVTVDNGAAIKLQGKADHPFTAGTLCVKVNQYLDQVRSPDRILRPLVRVGEKGEGRFEETSWSTAIAMIADRFSDAIQRHGAESIWPYQGTGNLGYIQGLQGNCGRRLWNFLGASRHHMSICSIAGQDALIECTGTSAGIDSESLAYSRLIVMWGVNTLTSGHHLWRSVDAARKAGATVVAIDPVRTRTAKLADVHLAPRPGTDAVLALYLLREMVDRGATDESYVANRTTGWSEFQSHLDTATLDYTASVTGISEQELSQLSALFAERSPIGYRVGMGLQRHSGGGSVVRLIACLAAANGDWGRYGGGVSYSTDGYFGINRTLLHRDDLLAHPVRELSMTRMGELLTADLTPPVAALFVYGANPVASSPGQGRVIDGLKRDDLFTVVADHFQTDTTDYADLVLPATMQTEHLDIHDGYGHMYVAWNEPAEPPAGESLPMTEMFRRIARAMNLNEPSLYDSDESLIEQLMQSDHPSIKGISIDYLRDRGWARLNYPKRFVPFEHGFPTGDGKFHFPTAFDVPSLLARELPSAKYPLQLLATADHFRLNSTFANNPRLARRAGEPRVTINPADATPRGIVEGDQVQLFNARGRFNCKATLSSEAKPGVVSMTKGHWMKLTGGSTVNVTVDERDSDFGGGAVFHDNAVEIAALNRAQADHHRPPATNEVGQ